MTFLMTTTFSDRHPVFVYGSLKAGHSNHHWLSGSTALGRRRLIGGRLHDLGQYPMAVLNDRQEGVIHGELYAVDRQGLERLDELEGYPSYYDRSQRLLSDGSRAWVYHGQAHQVADAPLVPYGDWRSMPVLHYGSNLNPRRLQERCPDWDGHGLVAQLEGWSWAIDKLGRRGADGRAYGYAGIRPSRDSISWGVVTHLSDRAIANLDHWEGVGANHYRKVMVAVRSVCGAVFQALTYVPAAHRRQAGLRAEASYQRHILAGLDHWKLPAAWRRRVASSLTTTA